MLIRKTSGFLPVIKLQAFCASSCSEVMLFVAQLKQSFYIAPRMLLWSWLELCVIHWRGKKMTCDCRVLSLAALLIKLMLFCSKIDRWFNLRGWRCKGVYWRSEMLLFRMCCTDSPCMLPFSERTLVRFCSDRKEILRLNCFNSLSSFFWELGSLYCGVSASLKKCLLIFIIVLPGEGIAMDPSLECSFVRINCSGSIAAIIPRLILSSSLSNGCRNFFPLVSVFVFAETSSVHSCCFLR